MPLRPITLTPHFLRTAPSCLIECGGTRVLCTATVQEGVPPFLKGKGQGWLTAEYAMLPASTNMRKARDGLKKDSRGVEISRLIGRSLRQAVDLTRLGERTITIDCDVLEADGGTRTASVTGGFVALTLAVADLIRRGPLFDSPIVRQVAAVSVGMVAGEPVLDLCYSQDSRADVDMNVVMDEKGNFIEVQGTGEGAVFPRKDLDTLLDMAAEGIASLMEKQRETLGGAARWIAPRTPRLLLATNNEHKARELRAILQDHYAVVSLKEAGLPAEVEENGATFAENAALKAEAVMKLARCAVLADDSGLFVDALGGAPGVYSARYAGAHGDDAANNRLLLQNLKDVAAPRTARFVCAMALARPGRDTLLVEGSVEGRIIDAPRGRNGFGYDPLFEYETGETFAEMAEEKKNAISHRNRAAAALLMALEAGA
ncbi:MAG: ribonuclease PH [Firmicutes bacterium]|nr:ribonuclease PH [Bacillota bacterium]